MHNWLDAPAPDRGAERGPLLFNERLAQREVARAGLLLDLANSFLVVAYPESAGASERRLGIERDWVARHYSLGRRGAFQKRATLRDGVVTHEPAPTARPGGPDAAEIRARIGLSQSAGGGAVRDRRPGSCTPCSRRSPPRASATASRPTSPRCAPG